MKRSQILAMAVSAVAVFAIPARGGAPQPDQRQGDFVHVCQGGPQKGQACTIPTEDTDCPRGACVLEALTKPIKGTLTIVAHDSVTDWKNGGATNAALTAMLEVKAPDGTRQILAATYQNVASPALPPEAPGDVIAIGMDEAALSNLSSALGGLLFVQPESTLAQQLQNIFGSTGTPVLTGLKESRFETADHTGDNLATVLRFKVKIQFLEPL
jgi:hypothetical protein